VEAALAVSPAGGTMAAVVASAAEASSLRRLMLKVCSVRSAMMPSQNEGLAHPRTFADLSAISPFPGAHRAASRPVGESAKPSS